MSKREQINKDPVDLATRQRSVGLHFQKKNFKLLNQIHVRITRTNFASKLRKQILLNLHGIHLRRRDRAFVGKITSHCHLVKITFFSIIQVLNVLELQ